MSTPRPGRPRRLPAVAVVVVLLGLAGVANATMRARPTPPGRSRATTAAGAERSMTVASSSVASTAWYCAGPLPVGRGPQASSIAVANVGDRPARGQLILTSTRGQRRTTAITVGAHADAVYGLPRTGAGANAAVTVLVDTATVGVQEIVHGGTGPMAARCAVATGHTSYLAEGSTRGAANVALAIYDPGATPAVASVTFATSGGGVTPPAFQGIDVAPGGLVVLDVGHEVPSQLAVASTVVSTGGGVVVGAVIDAVVDHHLLTSLAGGSPAAARRWQLAAAPLSTSAGQGFSVLDPTSRPARIKISLAGTSPRMAAGELTTEVPAGAVVDVAPAALPGRSSAGATVTATGAPVVVGRELATVAAPPSGGATDRPGSHPTIHAVHQRRLPALLALPLLPTGFAAGSGTTAAYRRWLLVGGEVDARVGDVVSLTDPGRRPAVVRLTTLTGTLVAPELTVAPGTSRVVTVRVPTGATGNLTLLATATRSVVAGELLYGTGATGLGVTTWTGIPIG